MKMVWMNGREYGSFQLPKEIHGYFSVNSKQVWKYGENITLTFEADSEGRKWILSSKQECQLELATGMEKTVDVEKAVIDPECLLVVNSQKKGYFYQSYLYAEAEEGQAKYCVYEVPSQSVITVGSNKECNIRYKSFKANESNYLRICYLEDGISLEKEGDNIERFLVYLNRKEMGVRSAIDYGDEIYICGMRIIVGRNFLIVNKPISKDKMIVKLQVAQIYDEGKQEVFNEKTGEYYFSSAPYTKEYLQETEIKVAAPPQPENRETLPLALTIGPSFIMGISSVATSALSVSSMLQNGSDPTAIYPAIIMSISMMAGSIVFPFITRGYIKQRSQKDDADHLAIYQEHIEKIKQEINEKMIAQKQKKETDYPSNKSCFMMVRNQQAQLWRRTLDDPEFMGVNIGLADFSLEKAVQFPNLNMYERKNEYTALLEEVRQLAEEKQKMPFAYSLAEHELTGIVGDRESVKSLAFGMILQLIALQNYDDLKIGVIYSQEENEWEELKWIPHSWSNDRFFKYMADTPEELTVLMNDLEYEKETRLAMKGEERRLQIPKYVIFVADRKLAERSQKLKEFYQLKEKTGISLVLLYDKSRYLPKYCKNIIQADKDGVKIIQCEEEKYNGQVMDASAMEDWNEMKKILPVIANIKLDIITGQKSFPESISLFEMLKIGKPEHYDFQRKWKESDPIKSLGVPIGVDSDGNEIVLDIHEKAHGPHGLIAGSTGSGKSEFIISYIEMMALHFSPEEVAFILIDFKGGGMAEVFREIPHVVGRITNLDGNDLKRSLLAIENELERRQKKFQEAGKKLDISNIDIYRYQEKYRQGKLKDPLPHLIIVCDEFAELRQQNEEFLDQLVRIARIGRSLGVHMILATQKPEGVVSDQIRANIKFWICLKVQDKYDSQSVIDRPDAAAINVPGRFFMKVGMNEVFVQGQSPFSGAVYYPLETIEEKKDNSIVLFDGLNRIIVKEKPPIQFDAQKQIDVMNHYISKMYKGSVNKLWLDKLPVPQKGSHVFSTQTEKDGDMAPYIGKYDDLQNQRQDDVRIPFSREGNAILYGISGSGILQFLNRMLYELIKTFDSSNLHLYLLDFDTGALSAFKEAPQVQDVVLAYQTERVKEVLQSLDTELSSRKQKFTEYGGSYQIYCQESGAVCPRILLVLNGVETFASIDEMSALERLLKNLLREGTPYGIYVMATAENNQTVFRWMDQAFRLRYVLQQNTQEMYYNILGRVSIYPEVGLGRGIFVRDQITYEFQTDLLFEEDGVNTYRLIKEFCLKQKEKEEKKKKTKISRKAVNSDGWFEAEWEKSSLYRIPVGTAVPDGTTVYYDLASSVLHFWEYDTTRSRKWQEKLLEKLAVKLPKVYCCGVECEIPKAHKLTMAELMQVFINEVESRAERIRNALNSVAGNSQAETIKKMHSISDDEFCLFVVRGIDSDSDSETLDLRRIFDACVRGIKSYYRMSVILLESSQSLSSARFDKELYLPYPNSGLWMGSESNNREKLIHVEKLEERQVDYSKQGYVVQQAADEQNVVLCQWSDLD